MAKSPKLFIPTEHRCDIQSFMVQKQSNRYKGSHIINREIRTLPCGMGVTITDQTAQGIQPHQYTCLIRRNSRDPNWEMSIQNHEVNEGCIKMRTGYCWDQQGQVIGRTKVRGSQDI